MRCFAGFSTGLGNTTERNVSFLSAGSSKTRERLFSKLFTGRSAEGKSAALERFPASWCIRDRRTEKGPLVPSSKWRTENTCAATAVGELSLVSDVTEMVAIERAFREYLFPEGGGDNPPQRETPDIDETLSLLINESIHRVGVPVAQMNRLQKAEGVRFLQKKGAFKVKNAGSIVARFYDISKFTIYNYLDGPRDKRKPKVAAGHDAEPAGD